jgi:transglutaminase-like putative cysteine protease
MQMLRVRHVTRYRYARPVRLGEHRMMLRPREDHDQKLLFERLIITPEPRRIELQRDGQGNFVAIAQFRDACSELCFDSEVLVARTAEPLFDIPSPGLWPFPIDVLADERDPALWAGRFLARTAGAVLPALAAMNDCIHRGFGYRRRLERGVQTPEETLSLRSGACRDFAVLLVTAARSLHLRARFVSGYVHCPAFEAEAPRLGGGHTHAWAQVMTPEAGWVDFDPTSGKVGPQGLVRVAVADDPADAAPIQGVYLGEAADFLDMQVNVAVEREAPTSNSPALLEPSPLSSVA